MSTSRSPATDRPGARRLTVLLIVILLSGLALRSWYASWGAWQDRFEDEQYSLANVRAILETGSLQPVSSYYPYPLFTVPPTALIVAASGLDGGTSKAGAGAAQEFSARDILLCRSTSVLWGTLTVLLAFFNGRRLFDRRVGLLAAVWLAFMPWAIHSSGYYKPDALLMATTQLAFLLALRALERPTAGRYAAAGAGVALALSSKLTGGVIAVPLTVGTLLNGRRDLRAWGRLALAGAVSVAGFLAINPYGRWYLAGLQGLQVDYAKRAAAGEMSRWAIPLRFAEFLTDGFTLGRVLGSLALIGLAICFVRSFGSESAEPRRTAWAMLVSYPLVFTALYAVQTPYFKPNNFLPLVPFLAMTAAWSLVSAWDRLRHLWPPLDNTLATGIAFAMLVILSATGGVPYVYRSLTPAAYDLALKTLDREFQPRDGRLAIVEGWPGPRPLWEGRRPFTRGLAALEVVESLDRVDPARLDLADGELFFADRLGGPAGDFYRARVARVPPSHAATVSPEAFGIRGPEVVAIRHRWTASRPTSGLETTSCPDPNRHRGRCLRASLPADVELGEIVSLIIHLGRRIQLGTDYPPAVTLDGEPLEMIWTSRQNRHHQYVTPRFRVGEGVPELRVEVESGYPKLEDLSVAICRWREASPHDAG